MLKKLFSKFISRNELIAEAPIISLKTVELALKQGDLLFKQKKYTAALTAYQKAIDENPHCIEAYSKKGDIFLAQKNNQKAIAAFQMAIALDPTQAYPYIALATLLEQKNNFDNALLLYKEALNHQPNNAELFNNIARILMQQRNKQREAEDALLTAIKLNPQLTEATINLGALYIQQGRFEQATKLLETAKMLGGHRIAIYTNLGFSYYSQNNISLANHYLSKATKLDPSFNEAKWNYSLSLLKSGDYKKGWQYYESRLHQKVYQLSDMAKRYQSAKKWRYGENISGKTIILHSEQGFGDTLQFVRYATLVAKKGATVILDCQPALAALLANVEGVSQVITNHEALPVFDLYTPLMSLPLLFNTTVENIPAEIPYIKINADLTHQWKTLLSNKQKLKVGLVWAGNARKNDYDINAHYVDQRRSITLEQLNPLSTVKNIQWVSLQKDDPAKQIKTANHDFKFEDYTAELTTFLETAAVITHLDLVITVDTAVAHLAAALGKPTWVLSRFDSCWRWLENRNDSPWYPTIRLFHQKKPGDWNTPILEIVEALTASKSCI